MYTEICLCIPSGQKVNNFVKANLKHHIWWFVLLLEFQIWKLYMMPITLKLTWSQTQVYYRTLKWFVTFAHMEHLPGQNADSGMRSVVPLVPNQCFGLHTLANWGSLGIYALTICDKRPTYYASLMQTGSMLLEWLLNACEVIIWKFNWPIKSQKNRKKRKFY